MGLAGDMLAAPLRACGLLVPSCGRRGWRWGSALPAGAGASGWRWSHAQGWKWCWGDQGKAAAGCHGRSGVLRMRGCETSLAVTCWHIWTSGTG